MESERNLMTTTEAARYLGLKPSYLYKMMMRRRTKLTAKHPAIWYHVRKTNDLSTFFRTMQSWTIQRTWSRVSGIPRFKIPRTRSRKRKRADL